MFQCTEKPCWKELAAEHKRICCWAQNQVLKGMIDCSAYTRMFLQNKSVCDPIIMIWSTCPVVETCKQTRYQNGCRQISIWERKYSTRFLMNNTHSCRMEGCGPPEISSPIPMVICERQGLPPSDLLFCFTCSRSCWRHLASAGPGKHSVHSNFCVNTEHPRSASLQVEIFDHLCWYSAPLQQIFCLLIWSFFFP